MAKGSSKQVQGKYAAYKTNQTCAANQKRRILRHLKAQPNDLQSKAALSNAGYKRKAAGDKGWTFKDKSFAQLQNSIIPNPAKTVIKGMFALQTRVRHSV
jgi:hypothetical protein